jgi:hypothetical protein
MKQRQRAGLRWRVKRQPFANGDRIQIFSVQVIFGLLVNAAEAMDQQGLIAFAP